MTFLDLSAEEAQFLAQCWLILRRVRSPQRGPQAAHVGEGKALALQGQNQPERLEVGQLGGEEAVLAPEGDDLGAQGGSDRASGPGLRLGTSSPRLRAR